MLRLSWIDSNESSSYMPVVLQPLQPTPVTILKPGIAGCSKQISVAELAHLCFLTCFMFPGNNRIEVYLLTTMPSRRQRALTDQNLNELSRLPVPT